MSLLFKDISLVYYAKYGTQIFAILMLNVTLFFSLPMYDIRNNVLKNILHKRIFLNFN